MNAQALLAILPVIITAAGSVAVMLGVSVRRDIVNTVRLTLASLAIALLTLPVVAGIAPLQVTPLLVMDAYGVFFCGLILSTSVVVTLLFDDYFHGEGNDELYLLLLTATLGAVVLVFSAHFAAFFLGLETMSVSLFAMIAYTVNRETALEAGVKYLILSGVSSSFLLFGTALVYTDLGTLEFARMAALASATGWSPLVIAGFTMAVAGLAFKLSLVPFHMWTSDVYEGAPAPVTAFVATVSKGAIFALLVRYFIVAGAMSSHPMATIFSILAVLSILVGNLLALQQTRLKRLLAYSSIAHMGYLLIPLVAGAVIEPQRVVEAVAFYLLAYFVTTLGAFGLICNLGRDDCELMQVSDLKGLFWTQPGLATVFTVMLMSLAGIPLTAGFIGKFYLFATGVEGTLWMLLMVLIAGSGIGLYYYLRVVVSMLKSPDDTSDIPTPRVQYGKGILIGLALVLIVLGVFPAPVTEVIHHMATSISGGPAG